MGDYTAMLTRDLSPAAPPGPVCGEPDERPNLRHLHVHAALWEAVGLLLIPGPGVYCGILGWEGGIQVIFPLSFPVHWEQKSRTLDDAEGGRVSSQWGRVRKPMDQSQREAGDQSRRVAL